MPRMKLSREEFDPKKLDVDYEPPKFKRYRGEVPPTGTIVIARVTKLWWTQSSDGTSAINLLAIAEQNVADKKKYNGLPISDYLTFKPDAAFRYQPFLQNFGITTRDIYSKMMVEDEPDRNGDVITSIADWEVGSDDALCRIAIMRDYYDGAPRAKVDIEGWLPLEDEDEDEDDEPEDVDDEDEEDEEPPARPTSKARSRPTSRTSGTRAKAPAKPAARSKTRRADEDDEDADEDDEYDDDVEDEEPDDIDDEADDDVEEDQEDEAEEEDEEPPARPARRAASRTTSRTKAATSRARPAATGRRTPATSSRRDGERAGASTRTSTRTSTKRAKTGRDGGSTEEPPF